MEQEKRKDSLSARRFGYQFLIDATDVPLIYTDTSRASEILLRVMYQSMHRLYLRVRMKKGLPAQQSIEGLQTDANVNDLD
jgi:hypothetical protein